jgi:hypothetical protein
LEFQAFYLKGVFMKKGLTKAVLAAMMMVSSVQAFAEEVSDLDLELGRGKIEAAMNDTVTLKAELRTRLIELSNKLEGNGDAKIGTVVDAELMNLDAKEMTSDEILQKINEVRILNAHVDKNAANRN